MFQRTLSLLLLLSITTPGALWAADYTVVNTYNSANGSMRWAIESANANPGPDRILFNITNVTTPPYNVQLLQPLPPITEAVTIDGCTQPDADCSTFPLTLTVRIDGARALGTNLDINANGVVIRGVAIINSQIGVTIDGNNNTIEASFVGVGNLAPTQDAIIISSGMGNIIGTDGDGVDDNVEGNVISSGKGSIVIDGSTGNVISGNLIGTGNNGTQPRDNDTGVILRNGAHDNIIGVSPNGSGLGNVISSNKTSGISITDSNNTLIMGNTIGLDLPQNQALPNAGHGVRLSNATGTTIGTNNDGTNDTGEGNVISGNQDDGIRIISSSDTLVRGNTIAGNGGNGINVLSGEQNLLVHNALSDNGGIGIDLGDDGPSLVDNLDADTGPNLGQNIPYINNVKDAATAGDRTVEGNLESAPNTTYTIQLYRNGAYDPTGYGEGEIFLGELTTTTDGSGNSNFEFSYTPSSTKILLSAVTIDPLGNTSEFSRNNPAPVNVVPVKGSLVTDEDTSIGLTGANAIVVTDEGNNGSAPIKTTLECLDDCAITLSQTTNLTFDEGDGASDTRMVFTGPLSDVNSALDGLTYLPSADFFGDAVFTITTDDLSPPEIADIIEPTEITVAVNPINDAPRFVPPTPVTTVQAVAGFELNFEVVTNDVEDDAVTVTATNVPANAQFRPASQSFTWSTELTDVGSYTVTFEAIDGMASTTHDVNLRVLAPGSDTNAPPTDTNAPPTDTNAPPTDTNAPPTDTNTPPSDTNAPPSDTNAPPTDTNAPPTDTNAPPTDTNTPPDAELEDVIELSDTRPTIDFTPNDKDDCACQSVQASRPLTSVPGLLFLFAGVVLVGFRRRR